MRRHLISFALVAGIAQPGAAQTPTIQQQFEAASAAIFAKDYAKALPMFEALETRTRGNPRSRAIVRLRKGDVLHKLKRDGAALVSIRAGLADLPADDPSLRDDRYLGFAAVGQITQDALDYTAAVEAFRAAEQLAPTPVDRVAMLIRLVETGTFLDPARAAQDLARLKTLAASLQLDKRAAALLSIAEGRLLLNTKRFAEARKASVEAVTLLGGLTSRMDLLDVAARSDTAVAAMMLGHKDTALKYMAYTGAGRLPMGSFGAGVGMRSPDCGADARLTPDDAGIVEFSIGGDGTVANVRPIIATRGDGVGLAFARAVGGWSWTPEALKEIPEFFRYRARVSMRCTQVADRPSVTQYLRTELISWLGSRGVAATEAEIAVVDARSTPALRDRLAAARQSPAADTVGSLLPRLALIGNSQLSSAESFNLASETLTILRREKAPMTAQLYAEQAIWSFTDPKRETANSYMQTIEAALLRPEYRSDPVALAALRLIAADQARADSASRSVTLLEAVTADSRLVANHPLRIGALIRLASIKKAQGDDSAARAAFEQSGLGPDQCALLDAMPRLRSSGNGSAKYSQEAVAWGFEGWSQVEFDIDAEGKTLNRRTILSYPPFVFEDAATEVVGEARFTPSFRPDGGLGCGNVSERVRFVIPG